MSSFLSGRNFGSTIQTSDIADNATTNAKMADDAIGLAELSATGTASSSTFLRGDNAWSAPASGYEFVSLSTMSSTSALVVSFDAGYDYRLVLEQWKVSAAARNAVRFGVASDTFRTSGYLSGGMTASIQGFLYGNEQTTFIQTANYNQNPSFEWCWEFRIFDPQNSAKKTQVLMDGGGEGNGVDRNRALGEGIYDTAEAHSHMQIYPQGSSLNYTSGTAKLYRIKNS
tara:strand:+ start:399 stop:1082 length:684 start_codon:yes stop_codon:yes gene_type:complete